MSPAILLSKAKLTIQEGESQNTVAGVGSVLNMSSVSSSEQDTFEFGFDGWAVENQSWTRKSISELRNVTQPPDNSSQVGVIRLSRTQGLGVMI